MRRCAAWSRRAEWIRPLGFDRTRAKSGTVDSVPNLKSLASSAADVARHRRMFGLRLSRGRRLALILGNCQAEAVRLTLRLSADFSRDFDVVRVPGVHEMQAHHLQRFRSVAESAELLIAQPVRSGFRGMGIGTDEVRGLMSSSATVLTFPVLYFEGLHPYQVNVHAGGDLAVLAPLTGYHDLRFLVAASRGYGVRETMALTRKRPPEGVFGAVAEASQARLQEREMGLDAKASELLAHSRADLAGAFFTVNHPSNRVLAHVVNQLLARLGYGAVVPTHNRELLAGVSAPVEVAVVEELGLQWTSPCANWVIRGERYSNERIAELHLSWYQSRPELVRAGIRQHEERLGLLGLTE